MKSRYFSELRRLLVLAAPLFAAQVLMTATGVVDTLMAGRYSASDLAAVAVGNSFWLPLFVMINGLLIATTTMVARLHGAGQHHRVQTVVQQSAWLALMLALLCVTLLLAVAPLLLWLDVDRSFADITRRYLRAIAWGFPAAALFASLRAFTEGMGRTIPFMVASLVAFLANIPLNYVLINGIGIFPELGGEGCGWATAASMWLQLVILLCYTSRAEGLNGVRVFDRLQKPQLATIAGVARLGLPIALAVFAEVSIFALIALLLAPLGATVVAGHQIALAMSHLIFMLPLSFSQALTIRAGFFLGAGQQQVANFVITTGMSASLLLSLFTAAVILLSRDTLVALFTTDPAVQAGAMGLFLWMALYQIPDHIQIAANAALRAYHDTRVPMVLILLVYWGLALPLGYVLARTSLLHSPLAAKGFWIGLLVGLSVAALLLGWRLLRVAKTPST